MAYVDKLKDPRWQKKRLEIFKRDHFTCKKCGDKKTTLNVHHVEYLKNCDPWDYPNEFLDTLCDDCHLIIEDIKKEMLCIYQDAEIMKFITNQNFIIIYTAYIDKKQNPVLRIDIFNSIRESIYTLCISNNLENIHALIEHARNLEERYG